MSDHRSGPDLPWRPAWRTPAPAGAARCGVAEPPADFRAGIEGEPLVELLRAVYAAGFAAGRRSREQ